MFIHTTKNLKQKGSLMIEVLVVAAIITASVLGASGVAQKSIYVSRGALHRAQASMLLEEGAEVVKILRDNNWTNISGLSTTANSNYYPTFSGGTWSLSSTPSTVGIFTRTVKMSSVSRDSSTKDIVSSGGVDDAGTKMFTVNVSWLEGTESKSVDLSFYVSNIF